MEQERARRRLMVWRRSFDDKVDVLEAEVKALRAEVNRLAALVDGFTDDGR